MTAPRYAALAAKLLIPAIARTSGGPGPRDRDATILLAERAIRRRYRKRIAMRLMLAAAAVAVLGIGALRFAWHGTPHLAASSPPTAAPAITVIGHPIGSGATVVDTGAPAPLAEGKHLTKGSRIFTRSDGHFALSLSTGTQLTVEEGGDLSIVESGSNQVFAIRAGAVRATVAKLEAGERFIIQTPDSEVEVRGTSFRVGMAEAGETCADDTMTRVSVYEGIVSVRHAGREVRVGAGQSWPEHCTAKVDSVEHVAKDPAAITVSRNGRATAPGPASPPAASDLGEQNDFFATALAAKKRGATAEAIQGFEAFIARYPSSSLVESALAQRMKLLRGVDAGRAKRAASDYLARYPHGFARADAESIERQAP